MPCHAMPGIDIILALLLGSGLGGGGGIVTCHNIYKGPSWGICSFENILTPKRLRGFFCDGCHDASSQFGGGGGIPRSYIYPCAMPCQQVNIYNDKVEQQKRRTIEYRSIVHAANQNLVFWIQLLTHFTAEAAKPNSCPCQTSPHKCMPRHLFQGLALSNTAQTRAVAPHLARYFGQIAQGWVEDPSGATMWPSQTLINTVCNPLRYSAVHPDPTRLLTWQLQKPGMLPYKRYSRQIWLRSIALRFQVSVLEAMDPDIWAPWLAAYPRWLDVPTWQLYPESMARQWPTGVQVPRVQVSQFQEVFEKQ